MAGETERIVVSDDGLSLPVIEVLTGRGAIFGKSGSGKSNTASVVVEELLEKGFPVMIVDIEGEYATLSDRYNVVHVGDGDGYDHQLFEVDPGEIVDFCLDQHRPVIVDVSEVLELERAERVITDTLQLLFSREKHENKPFLVIVEEIHEFLPQQGGLDDLGDMLIRIAKRGRKRGLGLLGMSQRPASVDKNFITQCDWLVFHRLTWENDTRVVKTILGTEYAEDVKELATGAAYLMADWEESVRTVRFRAKKTADAGDTPSLSASERRDLTSSGPERTTKRDPQTVEDVDRETSESTGIDAEDAAEVKADADTDEAGTASPEPVDSEMERTEDPARTIVEEPTESTIRRSEASQSESAPAPPDHTEREEFSTAVATSDQQPEDPVAKILWELGQFVTFFVASVIGTIRYKIKTAVAIVRGEPKPADRVGSVSVDGSADSSATQFAIRLFVILVVLVGLLVLFAVAGV